MLYEVQVTFSLQFSIRWAYRRISIDSYVFRMIPMDFYALLGLNGFDKEWWWKWHLSTIRRNFNRFSIEWGVIQSWPSSRSAVLPATVRENDEMNLSVGPQIEKWKLFSKMLRIKTRNRGVGTIFGNGLHLMQQMPDTIAFIFRGGGAFCGLYAFPGFI